MSFAQTIRKTQKNKQNHEKRLACVSLSSASFFANTFSKRFKKKKETILFQCFCCFSSLKKGKICDVCSVSPRKPECLHVVEDWKKDFWGRKATAADGPKAAKAAWAGDGSAGSAGWVKLAMIGMFLRCLFWGMGFWDGFYRVFCFCLFFDVFF